MNLPDSRSLSLPERSVVAVPPEGITLHRLVTALPPRPEHFGPKGRKEAEQGALSELQRVGISMFLTAEQAAANVWKDTQIIVQATIPPHPRIHVARTDLETEGHIDVFAAPDILAGLGWQPVQAAS